ncbi:MAG: DUF3322 domain-containing protein [Gallionella sp.]|nr:DUF3322 domain-containing protein [Gallionella sp.]
MWTTPKDLKAQLVRLWERGELLRDIVSGNIRFPLRLSLKTPGSADITDRFESVRSWAAELSATSHVRLEWQEVRHRVQGAQRLPAGAWVDSLEDALNWLGKRRERERFITLVSATQQANPALLIWLEKRPLQALELVDEWPRLLAVVEWLMKHPHPSIYLRQVDLPGVHTKFIESHRGVLTELFDLALPDDAIDATKTGIGQFEARYGFLDKPIHIRFHSLDQGIQLIDGLSYPDISLDADSFSCLSLPIRRVFITENEINFLAFPNVKQAIVIFGKGFGWDALARSRWLNDCAIYYWGDIDTHGFAILDQLRCQFGHVESFLMDRETLDAHSVVWGVEAKPSVADLPRLTKAERALYDDLRDNRIRPNLRLEQEHVMYSWLSHALQCILEKAGKSKVPAPSQ